MADDPYADFRDDSVPTNLDTVLVQLSDELVAAQEYEAQCERELEKATEAVRDIAEKRIPAATDGLEGKFNLSDGRTLEVKETIRASIAGEKRVPAIQWMDEHDYGHIVKRQLVIELGKGDDEKAKSILKKLQEWGDENCDTVVVKQAYSVHPQTLVAWVKEMLGEGVDLPTETFGIFRQRTAKVKE